MLSADYLPRQASETELLRHERDLMAKVIADAWRKAGGKKTTPEEVKAQFREMAQTLAAVAAWKPPDKPS